MLANRPLTQGEGTIAESLARFVGDLRPSSIPSEVLGRAKYLILDAVGIAYASSTYEFARCTLSALTDLGSGDSDVIGFAQKLGLRDAVLMNGVLVHGLDYDDTHLIGVVHATASCFPCALGVAAHLGRSGRDLLAAYVAGMEVAARVGAVAKGELNQIGFHPTGVVAAFAASLIAGRLHGLDPHQLAMAQGIVLSMASGTREYSTDSAGPSDCTRGGRGLPASRRPPWRSAVSSARGRLTKAASACSPPTSARRPRAATSAPQRPAWEPNGS